MVFILFKILTSHFDFRMDKRTEVIHKLRKIFCTLKTTNIQNVLKKKSYRNYKRPLTDKHFKLRLWLFLNDYVRLLYLGFKLLNIICLKQ